MLACSCVCQYRLCNRYGRNGIDLRIKCVSPNTISFHTQLRKAGITLRLPSWRVVHELAGPHPVDIMTE